MIFKSQSFSLEREDFCFLHFARKRIQRLLHGVVARKRKWDKHMRRFIPWRTITFLTIIVVVLIIAAIWGVSHGGGQQQPSNYDPSQSQETQQQTPTQSTGWQPVNIGGWQLALQSARIDNSYPIYYQPQTYQPQNKVAELVLHVSFSPQSVTLPAQMNADDFYIVNTATQQTNFCVTPDPMNNGANWSFEERSTEEGDTVCLVSSDIQTAHTYQVMFVDKGINDNGAGGDPAQQSGGAVAWNVTVKDGAVTQTP